MKAFIHKGRALTHLKQFDEALAVFKSAKECDKSVVNTHIIDDYIKEMERCRQTDNQEKSVSLFLQDQNNNTPETDLIGIIENLNKKTDENLLYYSGGLRALVTVCEGIEKKTMFRIKQGFKLFTDHSVISKFYDTCDEKSIVNWQTFEVDLITSVFEVLDKVCSQCGKKSFI